MGIEIDKSKMIEEIIRNMPDLHRPRSSSSKPAIISKLLMTGGRKIYFIICRFILFTCFG